MPVRLPWPGGNGDGSTRAATSQRHGQALTGRPAVLLLGAESMLGQAVSRTLSNAGFTLTQADAGCRPGRGRLAVIAGPDEMREAVATHDLVCNVMPVTGDPRGRRARQRRAMLEWLGRALHAEPETRLIQRSTAMLYRDGGSQSVTEAWPVRVAALTAQAAAAENVAALHVARGGSTVVLRLGHLYGPGDPWTASLMTLARKGWQPLTRDEDAYFPTLHLDDAARGITASMLAPQGLYNVADSGPLTIRQLYAELAALAGRPRLHPLYETVRHADRELLSRSCKLDAGAFTRQTAWYPAAAPTAAHGLRALFG
jgi:nucleoside-diphosphate-sugar epimerase